MTATNNHIYTKLAQAIEYPHEDFRHNVLACSGSIEEFYPSLVPLFSTFKKFVEENNDERLEEFYTQTFDIQGVCCLDIGYVIFGEEYKRGEFLVNIARMFRENDLQAGSELADHLPNILRLLDALENNREKIDLISKILIPAMDKMLEKFPDNEGDKVNVYRYALLAIKEVFLQNIKDNNLQ